MRLLRVLGVGVSILSGAGAQATEDVELEDMIERVSACSVA